MRIPYSHDLRLEGNQTVAEIIKTPIVSNCELAFTKQSAILLKESVIFIGLQRHISKTFLKM